MVSALRMCLNVAEPLREYLNDNSDWSRRLTSPLVAWTPMVCAMERE